MLAYVPPPTMNGLDRNDPGIRFGNAQQMITFNSLGADSSLVWASRLNPGWALPLYGRAICQERLWFRDERLSYAVTGEEGGPSRAQLQLYDSLMLAATTRDPFPDRRMEAELNGGRTQSERFTIRMGKKKVKLPEEVDGGQLKFLRQDFKGALSDWAVALRKMPELYFLHGNRAEAFFALRSYDSTITELRIFGDSLSQHERNDLVYEFQSRALTLFAIAHTQMQRDDYADARQSFQEALTVDLGFYMAHVRLAGVAFMLQDTTTALAELKSAVQLNETDPSILYFYGWALLETGADDSAAVQFRKAISVDPYYAAPYELLGRIFDAHNKTKDAIATYQGFIDHAARSDPKLIWVVARVVTLSGQVATRP